jgi:hypothetical protein
MSFRIPPAVQNERIGELRKVWARSFSIDAPSDAVFMSWFSSHSFLTIAFALSEASQKFCRYKGVLTVQDVVKYASAVMISRTKVLKNLKQKEKEKINERSKHLQAGEVQHRTSTTNFRTWQ